MRVLWVFTLISLICAALPAAADTVYLASGGKLSGNLEETPGDAAAPRKIVSPQGIIELAPELIVEVERETPEQIEYRERARKAGMTISDQWELVEWCRQNKMYEESYDHCELILQLDPDHAEARNLLGFQKRNGEWVQREEYMLSRGFVRYNGRWRTHQQVQLMEERRLIRAAQVNWYVKLKRWRESLGTPHERDNHIEFSILRDPMAMNGLIRLLGQESNIKLQRLYIETLGNLDGNVALGFLMDHSVYQNNPDHREMCMIEVLKHRHPLMIEHYSRFLDCYDNGLANRAADCLGVLEYPSAVIPLANVLRSRVIKQEYRQSLGEDRPHEVNGVFHYSLQPPSIRFDVAGPPGFYRMKTLDEFLEGSQSQHVIVWIENQSVYHALRNLTGGRDFGFHAAAWKGWYTQQQVSATPVIQGRRGD